MEYKIENLGFSASLHDEDDVIDVDECVNQFKRLEDDVLNSIMFELRESINTNRSLRDRTAEDHCFGRFCTFILRPYIQAGMVSRAATFSVSVLIPSILELETTRSFQFHKGALFYDTALAFLFMGDEARFEYYLAMTDEEDFLTHGVEGKAQERGMHNKKLGGLTSQTIQRAVEFTVQLANGSILSSVCPLSKVLGSPLSDQKTNVWRGGLDVFHHAEFFRLLNELRIFCGADVPKYSAVLNNPYVMLRLGKVLAHVAQWAESQLTLLQAGTVTAKTLHSKLASDPHLSPLIAVAGADAAGVDLFPGKNVLGANVDTELRSLLADIQVQTVAEQRAWRVLRILYIIRNSTAHQIESTLAFYQDRQYLLDLIQVTLVAAFVIQQRKGIVVV
jgi:hypothetical protein